MYFELKYILSTDYEDKYHAFFLSSSGTDSSTCGETTETACKTLDHVLSLYYNTTQPQPGLEIMTSISLHIDQKLMVSTIVHIIIIYSLKLLKHHLLLCTEN